MSEVHDDIRALQIATSQICRIEDKPQRHKAGMWLNEQCVNLDKKHGILGGVSTAERDANEVEFKAVVMLLLDHILVDALEDEDFSDMMTNTMETDPGKILKHLRAGS
jgi:hypothetical protein